MEKIAKELAGWKFLSEIPQHAEGFLLSVEPEDSSQRRRVFVYLNEQSRRSFSVLYDKTTKEYLARTVVGLNEFCDIGYMADNLAKLEELLDRNLVKTLHALGGSGRDYLGCEFLQKKIPEWPYAGELPGKIAGFELFIDPRAPLKTVNGSYIIIDYSDFKTASGLVIYYNIFRDEFFGELKLRHTPATTTAFDAKTLPELEGKIKSGLKDVLTSLRSKL